MSGVLLAAVGNSYGYKPINTVAPAITGTAQARQTLTCSTGTWNAAPLPITYSYQWQKNGSNISGATNSTYVVLSADVGSTLKCVVTATNAVGATSADSNTTATVIANVPTAPTIGTATATGSSTATVAFTASSDNGGATITGYTAVSVPGGFTGTGATSPITVSGLSPSTNYYFYVYATNSVGNSANSGNSNTITTQEAYWFSRTSDGFESSMAVINSSTLALGANKYYNPNLVVDYYSMSAVSGAIVFDGIYYGNPQGYSTTPPGLLMAGRLDTYNGNIYFAAADAISSSSGPYLKPFILNSSGGKVSERKWRSSLGANDIYGVKSVMDSSGNMYVLCVNNTSAGRAQTVVKFNSSGNFVWGKRVADNMDTYSAPDIVTNGSYIAIPGRYYSATVLCPLVMNCSDGSLAWPYQVWGSYTPRAAAVDSSNNTYFLFSGTINGTNKAGVIKFNSSGTFQWGRAASTAETGFNALAVDSSGNLYISGRSNVDSTKYVIVKLNGSGGNIWARSIRNTTFTSPTGVENNKYRLSFIGSNMYVPWRLNGNMTVAKLPMDGSRTGTYGNFVYESFGDTFQDTFTRTGNSPYSLDTFSLTEVTADNQPATDIAYSTTVTNL